VAGVVLHSPNDDVVPYSDSEELAEIGGYELFDVGKCHRMSDPQALRALKELVF